MTLDQLLEHYPNEPAADSLAKEADRITAAYGRMIAAAPFCVVATAGPNGLDCCGTRPSTSIARPCRPRA